MIVVTEIENVKEETTKADTSIEQNTSMEAEPANEASQISLETTLNDTQASVDTENHS